MRIACPGCAATYEVPEFRLTPGKIARCARCGGEWMPEQEAAHDIAADVRQEHEPREMHADDHAIEPRISRPPLMDRPATLPPAPMSRSLIGAWIATIIIFAMAVSATIIWRQEFMRIWPPSSRILGPMAHMQSKAERIPGNSPE